MATTLEKENGTTQKPGQPGCEACGGKVEITFGPYGFLSTCVRCGREENLDDMLEPMAL